LFFVRSIECISLCLRLISIFEGVLVEMMFFVLNKIKEILIGYT